MLQRAEISYRLLIIIIKNSIIIFMSDKAKQQIYQQESERKIKKYVNELIDKKLNIDEYRKYF